MTKELIPIVKGANNQFRQIYRQCISINVMHWLFLLSSVAMFFAWIIRRQYDTQLLNANILITPRSSWPAIILISISHIAIQVLTQRLISIILNKPEQAIVKKHIFISTKAPYQTLKKGLFGLLIIIGTDFLVVKIPNYYMDLSTQTLNLLSYLSFGLTSLGFVLLIKWYRFPSQLRQWMIADKPWKNPFEAHTRSQQIIKQHKSLIFQIWLVTSSLIILEVLTFGLALIVTNTYRQLLMYQTYKKLEDS